MRYFLDCEFNGFGGELMTMALVREDGLSLYLDYGLPDDLNEWVRDNVVPHIASAPVRRREVDQATGAQAIADYLSGDPLPYIISDWPYDIRYFCQALLVGPGQMAPAPNLRFEMVRVHAYPTRLEGAVQHNAWWDSMALRDLLLPDPV